MGYLAGLEVEARSNHSEEDIAKRLEQQHEFLLNHICNWAFGFLEDLQRYAFHPFYKGVGALSMSFLETEKEYLDTRQTS